MRDRDVLLLPGMMLDARVYEAQVARLGGRACVAVGDIGTDKTVGAIAGRLLADAPGRFALVGLSMGGIVALEIWRRAPSRVTHLALLDTTPYADAPARQAARLEQMALVDAGRLRDVVAESMAPRYFARRNSHNVGLLQSVVDQALALGPDVFRSQSLALRDRRDSLDTLPTIDCPALVLCGREDQLCPVEYHVFMAQAIPRADLVVLSECGHLSPMEKHDAVSTAIERLLDRAA